MSITVTIDKELLRRALAATNIHDREELINRLLERERASLAAVFRFAESNDGTVDLLLLVQPRAEALADAAAGRNALMINELLEREISRLAAQASLANLGGTMPDLEVPRRRRPGTP
ncbi:MAG: hypothetical protein HY719_05435 [Planctomycetes bacterium]|nr:hypothetical protein [Planctomycetota bacterium]